jgi:hypothetical protein
MEALLSSQPAYLLAPVTAVHPSDLETDDSSLATEVLPAPPSLASITGQRRDSHLKRPAQVFSYLPASDPGSTYSGLMGGLGLSLVPEEEGRLRKRARIDKSCVSLSYCCPSYLEANGIPSMPLFTSSVSHPSFAAHGEPLTQRYQQSRSACLCAQPHSQRRTHTSVAS